MTHWREGVAYLQVRPHSFHQLRVVKATQRPPEIVESGCVVVKVRLRIPDRAFAPLQPEATVTVPEELVQHPIVVEAVDPS
ncbi:hypothetical protein Rhe02_55390 [Rhizocola hellebori]|uniref:Uncharacterized protein n=1 Tax=Rhizocola hellebori TaxID=1392758 RepID=A0A8J3QCG4_9ACTN|nr:hypothetical protein Rhe02_55390 [Rhizocola hellebori]